MGQYTAQTKDAILARMLATVADDIDKRQGSVVYDMQSPAAIEAALLYIELDSLLDKGFADTTFGDYLDRRTSEMGVYRKPAVKASGNVTFAGANGTLIKAGQRVSTDTLNPAYFVTRADVTIASGSATVAIDAEAGGKAGNVAAGAIKLTVGDITGAITVTNSAATDGGSDIESDTDLLARYKERVSTPSVSGNSAHYRTWAKSIAGISEAKIYPVWNGNGTVKVVLLGTDNKAPIASKVTEVSNYIETQRPIGASVTVQAATEVAITVSVTVTLATGATIQSVKDSLTAAIKSYLDGLAFKDPLVRYTQIQRLVLDVPNVVDYTNLLVNNGTANIDIADGSVAILGTVTVS